MLSENSSPANAQDLPGLPPVTPPSGRFIAQLFVIPGLIVTVAVGCIWFVTWLVGGFFTPEHFLKDLRSSNAEVRWRRASDLAQVLKRDEALAANPTFALDLADLLRQALRDGEQSERSYAERLRDRPASATGERPEPPKALQDERAFIEFLIPCLGNFVLPAGVPLLNELAAKDAAAPALALRRQLAVWSLANAGENLKRYDRLPAEKQQAILASLESEAESAMPERRQWARQTLDYLKSRPTSTPQPLQVDATLAKCAAADDPTLRKFVALALTFWEGSPEENGRMEETLLALSRDDGHGKGDDRNPRGREIRYQATLALARRGSAKVATRLPVLAEMLDEEFQAKQFRTQLQDGREVADGATVGNVLTGALKAVAELHRKKPDLDLSKLNPAIDKLAKSNNPALRKEAERTQLVLNRQ